MKISTVEIRDKYEVYFKDRYEAGSISERIGALFDYIKGEGGLIQEVGRKDFRVLFIEKLCRSMFGKLA